MCVQLYSKIKNIYLAAHGLLLPWKAEPGVKTYRRSGRSGAERGTLSGWRAAGKAGPFLLGLCRSRWFYRCGTASHRKCATIEQKRAKFGLDAKTGRMYNANRKPVRRALKRK